MGLTPGGYALAVRQNRSRVRGWMVRGAVGLVAAIAVVGIPVGPAQAATCNPPLTNDPTFRREITETPPALRRLQPERVWPVTRGGGVTVAVIDSGVSDENRMLDGKVRRGFDLIEPGGDGRCDTVGHGTLIAGLIAGRNLPGSKFTGVAPDARILPVRALSDEEQKPNGNGNQNSGDHSETIAEAIRRAVDADADVINLSLTTAPTDKLAAAVRYALDHDVVVVAAAGNTNTVQEGFDGFPAAYEGVIAVASANQDGGHLDSSVVRPYIDLAAPGQAIFGPAPQGGFIGRDGTSFASAYVAGVVALVRSYRPGLKADAVARRVIRTADRQPDGWNSQLGYGVLNPYWAVVSLSAEEQEPAPPVRVGLLAPKPDPLRTVKLISVWATVVAIALSVLLVSSVSVMRRGQRRGWRPGGTA